MNKTIYLCNGQREGCSRTSCGWIKGNKLGECFHTMDERARRHKDIEPQTHPERFTRTKDGDWFELYKREKRKD